MIDNFTHLRYSWEGINRIIVIEKLGNSLETLVMGESYFYRNGERKDGTQWWDIWDHGQMNSDDELVMAERVYNDENRNLPNPISGVWLRCTSRIRNIARFKVIAYEAEIELTVNSAGEISIRRL